MTNVIEKRSYERDHLLKIHLVNSEELLGQPNHGGGFLERSLLPSGGSLSQIFVQDKPFILTDLIEPREPLLQQQRQQSHCSRKHLFRLTPFRSILFSKENDSTAMHGDNPVAQGALQRAGSTLTFHFIQIDKFPAEASGKLLEIVEIGSRQNSSPAIMLWAVQSKFIIQPTFPI